jgi:hypothetical protein
MVVGRIVFGVAFAVLAAVGGAPTAVRASTYTQALPAGCTAPTLTGTTLYCNGTAVLTIVDYPCDSQLVLGNGADGYTISCATPNYSGLYWVPSESGQGYTLTHQANGIFLLAYIYGDDHSPQWLSMLAKLDETGAYVGEVLSSTGAPGAPFPHYYASGRLMPNSNGTIDLTIGSTVKTLQRYDIGDGAPLPTCTFGATPAGIVTGLWWDPAHAGAGFGIHDQSGKLFLTWYSYDAAGNPRWAAALLGNNAAGTWSGQLYATTGPSFTDALFDAASVTATPVAAASLAIADANHATFITGGTSIPLTRFVFSTPGTACQ